jgi:cephalosporin-C deacetylase-like acetyl esterase
MKSCCLCAALIALLTLTITLPSLAQTGHEAAYQAALPLYADNAQAALDVQTVSTKTGQTGTVEKLTYAGKDNDRVPTLFFLPPGATTAHPVPALLLLHGLGGSKEQMAPIAGFISSLGYAVFVIDEAGQGERKDAAQPVPVAANEASLAKQMVDANITTVVDLRRGIDYLQTRPEIKPGQVGMLGISLGALVGAVLAGVDSRVKIAMLVSGGGNLAQILTAQAQGSLSFGKQYKDAILATDPITLETQLASIDPINFVAHISPRPLLMEHGRLDKVIPPEAAQALFDAAAQPKQIDWYPNAGHPPSLLDLYDPISDFLAKNLPAPEPAQPKTAQTGG